MKLILVMVTSLDGKSTRGENAADHSWISSEDQQYFMTVIENAKIIIMGRNTYESAKSQMQHRVGRKRIVLTRTPEKFTTEKIDGLLEFTDENPIELIKRLEREGCMEAYLLGGAGTNTLFFKNNLVTEIWHTIEPKILGQGIGIIGDESIDINLRISSYEKINDQGTLLLKYTVINSA